MRQSNIATVERFFDLRNRGDAGFLDDVDADAEFDLSNSRSPYRGIYRGHEEIRAQWQTVREAWTDDSCIRPEDPVEVGDHVIVTARVSARGRNSGIELAGTGGNLFTLKDGKIVRLKLFQTRAEALDAARQTEQQ